jgi:hypothetical protein
VWLTSGGRCRSNPGSTTHSVLGLPPLVGVQIGVGGGLSRLRHPRPSSTEPPDQAFQPEESCPQHRYVSA